MIIRDNVYYSLGIFVQRTSCPAWDPPIAPGRPNGTLLSTFLRLLLEEREQIGADLVLMRRAHTMVETRVDFQRRVLDEFGGEHG
jgi:hypothetical protein